MDSSEETLARQSPPRRSGVEQPGHLLMHFLKSAASFNLILIILLGLSQPPAAGNTGSPLSTLQQRHRHTAQKSTDEEYRAVGEPPSPNPLTLSDLESFISDKLSNRSVLEVTDDKLYAEIKRRGIDFELGESILSKIRDNWPETRTLGLLLEWQKYNKPPQVTVVPKLADVAYGNEVELSTNVYDPDGDSVKIIWSSECPCLYTTDKSQGRNAIVKTGEIAMQSGSKELEIGLTVMDYRGHRRSVSPIRIKVRKQLSVMLKPAVEVLQGKPLHLEAAVSGASAGAITYHWQAGGEQFDTSVAGLAFDTATIESISEDSALVFYVTVTDSEGARGTASQTVIVHPSAVLNLRTNAEGVTISVDGARKEELHGHTAKIYLRQNEEHEIEIAKAGFATVRRKIEKLAANSIKDLYIEMVELKPDLAPIEMTRSCVRLVEGLLLRGAFDEAMRECNRCIENDRDNQELVLLKRKIASVAFSGNTKMPKAIYRVDPIYPTDAKRLRISGIVEVEVNIAEDGRPKAAKAISGPSLLRGAAESAAMQWRFKPASMYGQHISHSRIIRFNFTL
jgi:TonB family protein